MAEMMGSESKYSGQRQGATTSGAQGAKAGAPLFGSSVVTPPISAPMQNIAPGSQEWINARMASIIEQLRQQYGDAAARRGMLNSGASEEEFAKAVQDEQTKVALEAANYNAEVAAREDQQAHERGLARDQARSAENAAMYSGIAQTAPYMLFGKWGKEGDPTLASKGWTGLKDMFKTGASPNAGAPAPTWTKGAVLPDAAPQASKDYYAPFQGADGKTYEWGNNGLMNTFKEVGAPAVKSDIPTPQSDPATVQPKGFADKAWDRLKAGPGGTSTETWNRLGAGALGTGVGTMLSSGKNKTASLLAGLGATGLGARAGMSTPATAGLAGLSSAFLSNKTLAKPFSKDNWWKTLIGAGGLAGAGGLFGKF